MFQEKDYALRLKYITDMIRQNADAAFSGFGLTGPQVRCLNAIRRAGGTVRQRDLERHTGVSHATIAGIMNRLAEKGYVTVEKDEKDGRNRVIRLTEKAEQVNDQLSSGEQRLNERLVRGFSPEKQEEFSSMLGQIESNLKGDLKNG